MTRRYILTVLGGLVLDPERLLWVPGKKLISIPSGAMVESIREFSQRTLLSFYGLKFLEVRSSQGAILPFKRSVELASNGKLYKVDLQLETVRVESPYVVHSRMRILSRRPWIYGEPL